MYRAKWGVHACSLDVWNVISHLLTYKYLCIVLQRLGMSIYDLQCWPLLITYVYLWPRQLVNFSSVNVRRSIRVTAKPPPNYQDVSSLSLSVFHAHKPNLDYAMDIRKSCHGHTNWKKFMPQKCFFFFFFHIPLVLGMHSTFKCFQKNIC